nr:hypothetical protein [uncultured Mediterranean phage uvMED]
MAVSIPQVVTEDRASGALVVDGSLRFDESKGQYLRKAFTSEGNRRTFTWSCWLKVSSFGDWRRIFTCEPAGTDIAGLAFRGDGNIDGIRVQQQDSGVNNHFTPSAVYRDTGWYHLVMAVDTTLATSSDRIKVYVNGELQSGSYTNGAEPAQNSTWFYNSTSNYHEIGNSTTYNTALFDGHMTQCYWIDGQQLGPEEFGYTDGLTGTWRPKKYTRGVFGELDKFNTYTWGESQNQLRYQGIKFPSSAGGTVAWKATGSSNTGLNLYTSTDNSTWTRRLTNQTVDSTNGLVYESSDQYVILVNGTDTNWSNQLQLFSDVNGATIHYSNTTYPGNGSPTMSWSGPGYTDGTIASYNSFYLPMDGNSPIGQDQSGNGNNWKPVNFGGSNSIEKATGALPILNTLGGTVARSGVFGSEVSKNYTTTSNTAAGSGYEFDQTSGFNPSLSFVRGATYTFDYTDSSSHPLRFSSTDPDSSVTSYTDGTNTSVSNTVKITVPHNAPDTLYYYCTSHNSMNGSISVTTDETKADPYAWKCTVAMPMLDYASGTRADFSNDLNCTTTFKSTDYDSVTSFANPGGMFYDKVARFVGDGSNDRVRIPSGSFAMGTGDFTIEFWGHFTATGDQGNRNARILTPQSESGNYFQFLSATSSATVIFKYNGGGSNDIAIPNSECINRTRHYVYQRTGTTGQLIVDGVLYDTGTDNVDYPDVAYQIGRYDATNGGASLYMADLRAYTGIQKYSTSGKSVGDQLFIPASTSPDILPDTPSGVATKTQLTKITDGAVSIIRSSDQYLQAPASTDFRLDGQYCIEFFLKLTDFSTDGPYVRTFVLDGPTGDGGTSNIHLNVNPSNGAILLWSGSGELIAAQLHVTGNWHHICLTRDSSNVTRLFVDGRLNGSATISTDYDLNSNQNRPRLGALGSTGGTTGYYSNWRIIKGSIPTEYQTSTTTLFDKAFNPPTEALTTTSQGATANDVKLIACQSPTSAGAAAVSPNLGGINDGRVWSDASNLASPGLLFDGDDDTFVNSSTTSGGNLITSATQFTVPEGQTLTIRTQNGGASNISVNGSNVSTNSGNVVTTLLTGGVGGTLVTSITAPTGFNLYYLKVNGVALMDPVAPIGNAAATNFNPFNTDINTVRGQETGYCTFNPLIRRWSVSADSATLSNGNFRCAFDNDNNTGYAFGSMLFPSTGKFYFETHYVSGDAPELDIGIGPHDNQSNVYSYLVYKSSSGVKRQRYAPGSETSTSYGATYSPGDTIGCAVDMNAGNIEFFKNGISQGVAFSGASIDETWGPFFFGDSYNGTSPTIDLNTGQKPFKFPPPDGFQPLTSSTVRPDTVIPRPDKYVGVKTYSGNEGTQTISGLGMSPDFIWIKCRNDAVANYLADTVRGVNKNLQSNAPGAEVTNHPMGYVSTTTRDGFTLVSGASGSFYVNGDPETYVAWTWKAGGNSNTFNVDDVGYATASAAGLNGGTITPTGASVGTKQGFSIITYDATGSNLTVSHGLSKRPGFIILKSKNVSGDWLVWHQSLDGVDRFLKLNDNTVSQSQASNVFISIDENTFGTGNDAGINSSNQEKLAYIWHDVPGLQKFGIWSGNGSADGPFIETGFRPAVILYKDITSGGYWNIRDSSRTTYNGTTEELYPATNEVENHHNSDRPIDFLSNGFKIRVVNDAINNSSRRYVYAAWAEAPSFNLYGGQSNAR